CKELTTVRLGERKQNPTESKSRRLIVLCSGGRWFSPPPGAASSRLFYCFYGVNCSISMSLMNWFRSGFMVSLQGTLRRALACLFSDGESRGYWVRWLLVGGWERASQAPATVKLGDLRLCRIGILRESRVSSSLVRLVWIASSVSFCFLVIPALMWVCNSSIETGQATFRQFFGGLSSLPLNLRSKVGLPKLSSPFCGVWFLLRVVTGKVSSLNLGGLFMISFGEALELRSCAVPCYEAYGFSGILSKELWSFCSIAIVLEWSIANRVRVLRWLLGLMSCVLLASCVEEVSSLVFSLAPGGFLYHAGSWLRKGVIPLPALCKN
ncbi:hypothetical protein HID58_012819, partial [Brassica napus]